MFENSMIKVEYLQELQELKKEHLELKEKFNQQTIEHKLVEESLAKHNKLLVELNKFSLELAYLPHYDLFQHIIKKAKLLFGIKGAIITSYDESRCELLVEHSSLSAEENSTFTKLLGKKFKKYQIPLSNEEYLRITTETIKLYTSSYDLTFGAIPAVIGRTLETMFDVGWYLGISLIFMNKLVGTVIIVGHKNQIPPNNDEISIFAAIASNALGRMKAEGAASEKDKFTSRIIETANEGFWLQDSDFITIKVNQKMADMLGYSVGDFIGKEVEDFMFAEDIDDRIQKKKERVAGKSSIHERRFKRKDGTELFTLVSSTPLFDIDGIFEGAFGMISDITESKNAEFELKNSHHRNKALLESNPDLMFLFDSECRIIDFHSDSLDKLYVKPELILGKKVDDILSEYSFIRDNPAINHIIEDVLKLIRGVLASGIPDYYSYELASETQLNFFESRIVPCGKKEVLIIVRDITEQKQAELERNESISKTNALISSMPDMLFIIDKDGVYLDYHSQEENDLYSPPVFFIGKNFRDILPPDIAKEFEYHFKNALNTNQIQVYEYSLTINDKKSYYECRIIAYENNKILSIVRNITQRKNFEQEILESESRLKLLNVMIAEMLSLSTLDDIYTFIVDNLQKQLSNTIILLVSIDEKNKKTKLEKVAGLEKYYFDKILNLIGYNPVGKVFELLPSHHSYFKSGNLVEFYGGLSIFAGPEIPVVVSVAIDKIIGLNKIYTIGINKDDQLLACVHFFVFKNQEIHNINFIETFIKQAGIIIQKKIVVQDLKNREIELQELNASKDKFFSIIAHDLKSPFSGFLGLTKTMGENINNFTLQELNELSLQMNSSASNLYKLLENLLEWSRMKRGVIEFNPEMCNLTYLVKQNITLSNESAKLKNIDFINNIENDTYVNADIPMLNTVLRNLISNALKFTPIGGKVEIGLIQSSPDKKLLDVCIYIKDSGIGMDENTLKKLFKIDSKISRPGTEGESSTGLGLVLCNEFIEKHNGMLWAESEVGKGSTFYFTLANF